MKSQALLDYGHPLAETETDLPRPAGSEILLKISHCGVCHSDIHLQDGYFDLGDDKKLDLSGAHTLPFTLGHEIEGEVIAAGPEAKDIKIGERRVIYPFIGCDDCDICSEGHGHLCNRPQALGININGGYADHVIIPDPRYLLDCDGIDEGLAGTYMCSGLTAYSALKKASPLKAGQTIALVGMGGLGFMGLQFVQALYPDVSIIAADIDEKTLETARQNGADQVFDSSDRDAAKQILSGSNGGIDAAIDFVGSEASLNFAQRIVRKGGRVIVVGLFGGRFSLPIPMFALRELSIMGSYAGSLADAKDMLNLIKRSGLVSIPIEKRPLDQAQNALDDLRNGNIVGRVVLIPPTD
jgi:D-arabinose 1-dehydrogenase-like Zn-dependent alcohol dehydrogenase